MALINWRLFIGLCLSLTIGFLFDIQSEINKVLNQKHLNQELAVEVKINNNLQINQRAIKQEYFLLDNKIKQYPTHDLFSVLLHFYQKARLSGLSVQLVKPYVTKPSNNNSRVVKVWVAGKLFQLDAFFYQLEQSHFSILVENFSMHHLDHDNWRVLFYFVVFFSEAMNPSSQEKIKDDFSSGEWPTMFPLNQICYVGFIDRDHLQSAIIRLPNEKILPIQIGSVVGLEKARVMKITSDKIFLENKKHNIFLLVKATHHS